MMDGKETPMPRMVCVRDEVELQPKKNGVVVVETSHEDMMVHKLWDTDMWECPVCGMQVIAGFAAEAYQQGYELDDRDPQRVAEALRAQGKWVVFDYEKKSQDAAVEMADRERAGG